MAVFPSFKLTKKGEELLNRSIGEGKVLTFTKFEIGDGNPPSDFREQTSLVNKFYQFPVLSTDIQKNQILRIKGYFDNKSFTGDKQLKEIGVFVKIQNDETEYLYSYTNAGESGDIIPGNTRGFYSRTLDVANYIGYATNITFNIEQLRDKYAFNTENEMKVASYLKVGDKVELWGNLVLGDKPVDEYIVQAESADVELNNGLFAKKVSFNYVVKNIEELKKLNLKENDIIEVLGYYAAGDGAGHKRIIEDNDNGSGVQLVNGKWANRLENKNGFVCFIFDDNKLADDETYELFKKNKITCSFGIITDSIFYEESNTLEKLYNYQEEGFEILSHGYKHLANLTDRDIARQEYVGSRKTLQKLGFESCGFVSPYNEVADEVIDICENAYDYILVNGTGFHLKNETITNKKVSRVHINQKNLEENKQFVKKAMQENALIVFYAHQDDKGSDFAEFITWLAKQNINITTATKAITNYFEFLRCSSYLECTDFSFYNLTKKANDNNLTSELVKDKLRVQDHNSIGVAINERTIIIPATQSNKTITVQAFIDIDSWWSTYRISPIFKFNNNEYTKMKVTLEVIFLKENKEVKSYPDTKIDPSSIFYTNTEKNYTNDKQANKLKIVIRFVTTNDITETKIDFAKLNVYDLSIPYTKEEKKEEIIFPELDSLPIKVVENIDTYNKQGVAAIIDKRTNDKVIISVIPSTKPNVWSYQMAYDNSIKKMVYRNYSVELGKWGEWETFN